MALKGGGGKGQPKVFSRLGKQSCRFKETWRASCGSSGVLVNLSAFCAPGNCDSSGNLALFCGVEEWGGGGVSLLENNSGSGNPSVSRWVYVDFETSSSRARVPSCCRICLPIYEMRKRMRMRMKILSPMKSSTKMRKRTMMMRKNWSFGIGGILL